MIIDVDYWFIPFYQPEFLHKILLRLSFATRERVYKHSLPLSKLLDRMFPITSIVNTASYELMDNVLLSSS